MALLKKGRFLEELALSMERLPIPCPGVRYGS